MKAFYEKRDYASNRFMNKGVDLQMTATNWWEAKKLYNYSCMLCASRGIGAVNCASCPIRSAMLTNALRYWDKMPKQEKKFVEREQRLL